MKVDGVWKKLKMKKSLAPTSVTFYKPIYSTETGKTNTVIGKSVAEPNSAVFEASAESSILNGNSLLFNIQMNDGSVIDTWDQVDVVFRDYVYIPNEGTVTNADGTSSTGTRTKPQFPPMAIRINGHSTYQKKNDIAHFWVSEGSITATLALYLKGTNSLLGELILGVTIFCFIEGTPITMSDRTLKNIENLVAGDSLLTYNTETGEFESDIVTEVIPSKNTLFANLELSNGVVLTASEGHSIYVVMNGELVWYQIKDLKRGMEVAYVNQDGALDKLEVMELTVKESIETVYRINLENSGNYFANNVLTLNDQGLPSEFMLESVGNE